MVVRHGHVVAEGWWAPHTPERTRLLYSLSKSFTSTALGFALREGLFDLDAPVVSHFPEFAADITDAGSRSMTLRHLASMASGHDREMLQEAIMRDPEEPVRGFLLMPPDQVPGTVFAYSQPCTYALASIIQRNAGMPLTQLPAAPAVRPARHRPRRLADLAARPGAGLQRPVRPHRGHRQARPAVPAGRPMGRHPAHAGEIGRPGDVPADRHRGRAQPRLAAGLRLPVLDVPARIPRRRGLRAVLRCPARAGRGDRHDRRSRWTCRRSSTPCGRTCCPGLGTAPRRTPARSTASMPGLRDLRLPPALAQAGHRAGRTGRTWAVHRRRPRRRHPGSALLTSIGLGMARRGTRGHPHRARQRADLSGRHRRLDGL